MYKVILFHIFYSIVIFIINHKISRDEAIYKFIIVLFIPILGSVYFFVLYIIEKFNLYSIDELSNYDEYIKINKLVFSNLDAQKEINIVPVKEALYLNDSKVRRRILIDIVKNNPQDHIEVLKKAVENVDTETAHYAASAIVELKNKFTSEMQERQVIYESDKNNVVSLMGYIESLKVYLDSTFFDEGLINKYKHVYSDKLAEFLQINQTYKKMFIEKINCEIDLNNLSLAKEYCEKFQIAFDNNEEPYLMYMKLYYNLKDFKGFESTLKELMESSIKISNNALMVARFWREGDNNE